MKHMSAMIERMKQLKDAGVITSVKATEWNDTEGWVRVSVEFSGYGEDGNHPEPWAQPNCYGVGATVEEALWDAWFHGARLGARVTAKHVGAGCCEL
jgi:hypothetical protein